MALLIYLYIDRKSIKRQCNVAVLNMVNCLYYSPLLMKVKILTKQNDQISHYSITLVINVNFVLMDSGDCMKISSETPTHSTLVMHRLYWVLGQFHIHCALMRVMINYHWTIIWALTWTQGSATVWVGGFLHRKINPNIFSGGNGVTLLCMVLYYTNLALILYNCFVMCFLFCFFTFFNCLYI